MTNRTTIRNTKPDVTVVGAGFSGLYLIHRLRNMGLSVQVLEAATDAGGTWYWNRYPGARCDSDSVYYSYSFDDALQQEWNWSERYSPQPEILKYLQHVADRFDLRRDIAFEKRVESAVFNEAENRWRITTEQGDTITSRYLVMATGCLSEPNTPKIQGAESFSGPVYHTGRWPHEPVSFKNRTVGVIGTGSSAIQLIPQIAKEADQVYVFQRTPNFSIPARNATLDPDYVDTIKTNYEQLRDEARRSVTGIPVATTGKTAAQLSPEERLECLEKAWEAGGIQLLFTFTDIVLDPESNAIVTAFVHDKIRQTVKDPEVAEKLIPRSYPIGAKRICVDTDYYATFNRDNVTLVDVKADPITEIAANGLKTQCETLWEFDDLVYATGFDAMTGAIMKVDIRGREGKSLREKWRDGPKTFMGFATEGFPNLFMITGPGSPSVLSNMTTSIEQHVELVTDFIQHLMTEEIARAEPTRAAEEKWVNHVNEVAQQTLYPKANSWYIGANIPGKPHVFLPYPGGVGPYRILCDDMVKNGYEGFELSSETKETQTATV